MHARIIWRGGGEALEAKAYRRNRLYENEHLCFIKLNVVLSIIRIMVKNKHNNGVGRIAW